MVHKEIGMRCRLRKLSFELLESRRPFAFTAVDDTYELEKDGLLHVGSEKSNYHSQVQIAWVGSPGAQQVAVSNLYRMAFVLSADKQSIQVHDLSTRRVLTTRTSHFDIVDFSLTEDERYLFALEDWWYRSKVHRFDCLTQTWEAIHSPTTSSTSSTVSTSIEAVSENRILLHEWTSTIVLYSYDTVTQKMVRLSEGGTSNNGEPKFDHKSGLIFQGSTGVNPGRISVMRYANDRLIAIQGSSSDTHVSATTALASDGSAFYYGRRKLRSDDVSDELRLFSEAIIAATDAIAFGETGSFYDSNSGELLGKFDFPVKSIAVSPNNRDVWILSNGIARELRFLFTNEKQGVLANDIIDHQRQVSVELDSSPRHGFITLNANGSFRYIPKKGFVGRDSFRYTVKVDNGMSSHATVNLVVANTAEKKNFPPTAPDLDFHVDRGGQLRIEQSTGAYHSGVRLVSVIPTDGNVVQMEHSTLTGLLALRNTAAKIRILDPKTRRVVSERLANGIFTDMDLTPDGRYLMVADYVTYPHTYVNPSFLQPLDTYLHRYDFLNDLWTTYNSNATVCRVEAISLERVLTESCTQPVTLVLSSVSTDQEKLVQLHSRLVHYGGDIEYDSHAKRVYHSNMLHVHTFQIRNDRLEKHLGQIDPTGTNFRPLAVLSPDGKRLFSEIYQFDSSRVESQPLELRQPIYAASNELTFGASEIYDLSGNFVGKFAIGTEVQVVSEDSRNLWRFDPVTDTLSHYSLEGLRFGLLATANDIDGDPISLELLEGPSNGVLIKMDSNGAVSYTPKKEFVGVDMFKYRVSDGRQYSEVRTVKIHVDNPSPIGAAPFTLDDAYEIGIGQPLIVGIHNSLSDRVRKVRDWNPEKNYFLPAVSDRFGIIAMATSTGVDILDARSLDLISSISSLSRVYSIDLTADERFLFVVDIGYYNKDKRYPSLSKYDAKIHRYDIVSGQWVTKDVDFGDFGYFGHIQAISRNRIVQITNNGIGDRLALYEYTDDDQTPILRLDSDHGACSSGPTEYDHRSQRFYCASRNSDKISSLQILGSQFGIVQTDRFNDIMVEDSGDRFTISSDQEHIYRGRYQMKLGTRLRAIRSFPEHILAATGEVIVGTKGFYDALSTNLIQRLGEANRFASASSSGTNIWRGDGRRWQQWQTIVPTGVLDNDLNSDVAFIKADLLTQPNHGTLQFGTDGSFTYLPRLGFTGKDTFTYVARLSDFVSRPTTVTITVQGVWHNPINGLDVDADGDISPLDVLWIVNALNGKNAQQPKAFVGFLDVDDNQEVSAIDVLIVVNYLNSDSHLGFMGSAAGEGEGFSPLESEEIDCSILIQDSTSKLRKIRLNSTRRFRS